MKKRRNNVQYLPSYSILVDGDRLLKIKPTANAWWKREPKVHLLLAALKDGYKLPEACKRADISMAQYKYFARVHPEIREIRKVFRSNNLAPIEKTIAEKAKTDAAFALRLKSKMDPEAFPPPGLLKKIGLIESHREEEQQGLLDELRSVKHILGMYVEVVNELRPQLGGWYQRAVAQAEDAVRAYNRTHRKHSERILLNRKVEQHFPNQPPEEKSHSGMSIEDFEKACREAQLKK